MVSTSHSWERTRLALTGLEDILRCWLCNKVADDPQNFSMCGHFFCRGCVKSSVTTCPMCGVPSQACEVSSDRLVSSLIVGFKTVSAIVNPSSNVGVKRDDNGTETAKFKDQFLESETTTQTEIGSISVRNKARNSVSKHLTNRKHSKISSKLCNADSSVLKDEDKGNNSVPITTHEKRPLQLIGSSINQEKKVTNSRSKPIGQRKRSASSEKDFPNCASEASLKTTRAPCQKNSVRKDLSKRNRKGETPLHVACLKGDVSQVRSLLEAGANPNTKDHAGWTPLHEAVNHGFTEVVELLLKYGVLLDVPGVGNMTPLHEAVMSERLPIVRLLVAHGADIDARTSAGKTVKESARSSDILNALSNTEKLSSTVPCPPVDNTPVLCAGSDLDSEKKSELTKLSSSLGVRLATRFGPEITHLIVPADGKNTCSPSYEVLSAILLGKWILTPDWVTMSFDSGAICDPSLFELAGVEDYQDSCAPKLARLNGQKQFPGLLNGLHIFLHSNVHCTLGPCELSKLQISQLVKQGGGIILKREPDPEAIPDQERLVPYHTRRNSSLSNMSHVIIYEVGKGEPKVKYNMPHIKTLPIQWLIDSILHWKLLEP